MDASDQIQNRVANSGLVSLDLEEHFPAGNRVGFDLAPLLFQGLMLKEADFRSALRSMDWSPYQAAHVFLFCSTDAIVPTWAWMLLALHLEPLAATVVMGNEDDLNRLLWQKTIDALPLEPYRDARVVVKGCSHLPVPDAAFVHLSLRLGPMVKSLMFGEPCSTVPLLKRKSDAKGQTTGQTNSA
jgi:hypothetical protein